MTGEEAVAVATENARLRNPQKRKVCIEGLRLTRSALITAKAAAPEDSVKEIERDEYEADAEGFLERKSEEKRSGRNLSDESEGKESHDRVTNRDWKDAIGFRRQAEELKI